MLSLLRRAPLRQRVLLVRQSLVGAQQSRALSFTPSQITVQTVVRPSILGARMFSGPPDGAQVSNYLERSEVSARVINCLQDYDKVDSSKVTEDASLMEDLGFDSLDQVEVVMQLEDEFDIEISDDNSESIVTVKDAIELIARHPFAK